MKKQWERAEKMVKQLTLRTALTEDYEKITAMYATRQKSCSRQLGIFQ